MSRMQEMLDRIAFYVFVVETIAKIADVDTEAVHNLAMTEAQERRIREVMAEMICALHREQS